MCRFFLLPLFLPALAFASPEGTWHAFSIATPQALELEPDGEGIPVLKGGYDFDSNTTTISIDASGAVSGGGNLVFLPDGFCRFTGPGEPPRTFWRNASEDVMIFSRQLFDAGLVNPSSDGRFQDFGVVLKSPVSLAPSDIVGRWRVLRLQVPDRVTFEDDGSGTQVESGAYQFDGGSMVVEFGSGGTVQVDGMTTTYSTPAADTVRLQLEETVDLKINASKNLMALTESEFSENPEDSSRALILVLREATAPATPASFAGAGGNAYFDIPVYWEAYSSGGLGPRGGYQFDAGQERVTVSPFGTWSNSSGSGRYSLGAAGSGTSTSPGDPPFQFWYTENQEILVGFSQQGDETSDPDESRYSFTMVVRYERPVGIYQDPDDSTRFGVSLPLNPGDYQIQRLSGETWQPFTPSEPAAHFETASGSALFRVVENP